MATFKKLAARPTNALPGEASGRPQDPEVTEQISQEKCCPACSTNTSCSLMIRQCWAVKPSLRGL